ncbi:MAG TPA: hypothetical protein V6D08_21450 [Candidatus Obscuribacterales bacterium]
MDSTATSARVLEYKVEPLRKDVGETDVEAVRRTVEQHARDGWEIVDSCGDEVRQPVLIFQQMPAGSPMPEYQVLEVPHARGEDEIRAVSEKLWQMKEEGWLPECILDSPISTPVAVLRKSTGPTEAVLIKLFVVAAGVFEQTTEAIINELLDQQVRSNFTLKCIMHGGLNPVLVLQSKETEDPFEYLIEHAKGGIFGNKTTRLTDLISSRSAEGWQVCGAFEDAFLWPCVVFRRRTDVVPVAPLETVEAVERERES